MQQHTGQHVLSQAFFAECAAETVGFHLGKRYSTIDLNRIDLDPTVVSRAESAANAIVDVRLARQGQADSVFVDAQADARGVVAAQIRLPAAARSGERWVVTVVTTEIVNSVRAVSDAVTVR